MKLKALKNGKPCNDYGWTRSALQWATEKHPELHPDRDLPEKYEQQRCRYIKALIDFLKANPSENNGDFRREYDADLNKDMIATKWEGNVYEFYVEE